MSPFCYCCLADDLDLYDMAKFEIFIGNHTDSINVLDAYSTLAGVRKLKLSDPKICSKCLVILETTFLFKQMIADALNEIKAKRLQQSKIKVDEGLLVPYNELSDDDENPRKVKLAKSTADHKASRFNCDVCRKPFRYLSDKKLHRESHFSKFHCPHCPSVYNLRYNLHTHMKTHIATRNKKKCNTLYRCRTCNRCFKSAGGLALHQHQQKHENACKTDEELLVPYDDENHRKSTKLSKSLNDDKASRFICDVCRKTFRYLSDKKLHRESHFRKFRCPHCPSVYNLRYNLYTHMKIHGVTGSKTKLKT